MLKSRQEKGVLSQRIETLKADKECQLKEITELKETLTTLGLGSDFARQREIDVRELREGVERGKQLVEKFKQDVKKKIAKINEQEAKYEATVRDKDKEISTLQAEVRVS